MLWPLLHMRTGPGAEGESVFQGSVSWDPALWRGGHHGWGEDALPVNRCWELRHRSRWHWQKMPSPAEPWCPKCWWIASCPATQPALPAPVPCCHVPIAWAQPKQCPRDGEGLAPGHQAELGLDRLPSDPMLAPVQACGGPICGSQWFLGNKGWAGGPLFLLLGFWYLLLSLE